MAEPTLQITLARSPHGAKPGQRATVRSLGLRRRHQSVRQPDRPEIRGMVARVAHLVDVRYVGQEEAVGLEPGQEPKGAGRPPAGQTVADEDVAELREAEQEAFTAAEQESHPARDAAAAEAETGEEDTA